MNYTPQVETAEISDADLDAVSGGLAAGVSGGAFLHSASGDVCVDMFAATFAEGVVAGASAGAHAAAH
ncbi:hypothetical protein ACWD00_30375 [Streptomyces viridiviolaceus]